MLVKRGMMQNKLVIGVTGGSGCGKSIVSSAAESLGFLHIDTDVLGHEIILKPKPAYMQIVKEFGKSILAENGEIDRSKLGALVFADKSKLEILNSITHPQIENEVKSMLAERTVIDGAVLYKSPGLLKLCDCIIAVTNSDERRVSFICSRDGINTEAALKRIKSQPDNEFYSSRADYIINSDCDIKELFSRSVDVIKRCIIEKAY